MQEKSFGELASDEWAILGRLTIRNDALIGWIPFETNTAWKNTMTVGQTSAEQVLSTTNPPHPPPQAFHSNSFHLSKRVKFYLQSVSSQLTCSVKVICEEKSFKICFKEVIVSKVNVSMAKSGAI